MECPYCRKIEDGKRNSNLNLEVVESLILTGENTYLWVCHTCGYTEEPHTDEEI